MFTFPGHPHGLQPLDEGGLSGEAAMRSVWRLLAAPLATYMPTIQPLYSVILVFYSFKLLTINLTFFLFSELFILCETFFSDLVKLFFCSVIIVFHSVKLVFLFSEKNFFYSVKLFSIQ